MTLNLQEGCDGEIPDAWHHQMVFGVSPHGIYLCNPIECVPEETLWPRLASPSTLLVRSRDVISRFTPLTDLTPLTVVPDLRYHTFNVLGKFFFHLVILTQNTSLVYLRPTLTKTVRKYCLRLKAVNIDQLTDIGVNKHIKCIKNSNIEIVSSC